MKRREILIKKNVYIKMIAMIICLLCVISVTGCNSSDSVQESMQESTNNISQYQAYITSISDSLASDNVKIEYAFADSDKYTLSAEEKVTIAIGENEIEGEFKSQGFRAYNYYPTYRYAGANGEVFEITPDGALAFWYNSQTGKFEETDEIPEAKCLEIAEEFFANYADSNKYQVNKNEYDNKYEYTFVKCVGDIETTDYAVISVYKNGKIEYFTAFMLNSIGENFANPFDMKKAKQTVETKTDDILKSIKSKYDKAETEIIDMRLTVTKEAKVAMVVTVEINLTKTADGYDEVYGERIEMVLMS